MSALDFITGLVALTVTETAAGANNAQAGGAA